MKTDRIGLRCYLCKKMFEQDSSTTATLPQVLLRSACSFGVIQGHQTTILSAAVQFES